jgi:hypothetical protein
MDVAGELVDQGDCRQVTARRGRPVVEHTFPRRRDRIGETLGNQRIERIILFELLRGIDLVEPEIEDGLRVHEGRVAVGHRRFLSGGVLSRRSG